MIEDPDDSRLSIGKPKDALAPGNLIRLAGRKHRVWSSTSILLPREVATGKKPKWDIVNRTSCATVEFSDLGDDEIYELISSESWKGKAEVMIWQAQQDNFAE